MSKKNKIISTCYRHYAAELFLYMSLILLTKLVFVRGKKL